MKKRVKLLTTIASLCLAVALMAFGVYAATSVSFSTTSKVTFSATEIDGYWTLTVAGGNYAGKYATAQEVVKSDKDTHKGTAATAEVDDIEDIELTAEKNTVTYTLYFKNTGSTKEAYVSVTAVEQAAVAGYKVEVDKTEEQTVAPGADVTFVVTLTLDVDATGFDRAQDSNYTIDIDAVANVTKA